MGTEIDHDEASGEEHDPDRDRGQSRTAKTPTEEFEPTKTCQPRYPLKAC